MTLFQLKGCYGYDIGLYEVPNGLDVQECFNEAFDACDDEELELDDVDVYLQENFKIKRTYVEEVHTDKL
jgi:hypothetical protein